MESIIRAKLVGTRPLLMHSDKAADPLNPMKKKLSALTAKRKKTDEDLLVIAKTEWAAAMYFDPKIGPFMPTTNIMAALVAGGKLSKLGTKLTESVDVFGMEVPLEYEGPRDLKGLWDREFYDARSVKVQRARLMRYRPIFREWACSVEIVFDPSAIERDQVISCLRDAGRYKGIGDYRPRFGRFDVEVEK